MFSIYEGQKQTDSYDFITNYNETVDIKAAFKSNHRNLVVNLEQFNNISKKFYVGVKLNAEDQDKYLIYPNSIT